MKLQSKATPIWGITIVVLYSIITFLSWNNGYFWDNTQHTSIEAHWYYLSDFKSFFIPKISPEYGISSTGAPILLPLITAILWKVVGYKIWVSHAIMAFVAILLIYHTFKLTKHLLGNAYWQAVSIIILLESSVLTQYAIAGPDFILFTTFIITLRGVFEKKNSLILIASPILFLISTRGTLTGGVLVITHLITIILDKNYDIKNILKVLYPYTPAIILTFVYYCSYFYSMGWFFNNSEFSEAQKVPNNAQIIIGNFLDLGLRLIENGRIIIWIIALTLAYKLMSLRLKLNKEIQFILILFASLLMIYIVFALITNMPFLTRYFMPHLLLLTLFVAIFLSQNKSTRSLKNYFWIVLLFELSGHFWIYPEKMTKIWDSTLAHFPFYELRNECFNYIDKHKMDYKDISAEFCLYGNRRFYDLNYPDKTINREKNNRYFIYSNISNITDEDIDDLKNKNHWKTIQKFEKWPVKIIILENINYCQQTKKINKSIN